MAPSTMTRASDIPKTPVKRGRGRPPKTPKEDSTTGKSSTAKKRANDGQDESEPPKKRGRPRKDPSEATSVKPAKSPKTAPATTSKKRGRPSKSIASKPAVPQTQSGPPKKRGRPPKGGETTKIKADDSAAANQLEEQLQTTAEDEEINEQQEDEEGEDEDHAPDDRDENIDPERKLNPFVRRDEAETSTAFAGLDASEAGRSFWLMKAEQEDRDVKLKSGRIFNVKFTIDDLRARDEPEPWDGVRNAVAAKNMRTMRKGDLAFFYASGGKASRSPGITGIMEIVAEHSPDQSVHDEDSYGYVEKESDRARWCVVHVEFRKKLSAPVLLKDLQKYATGANDPLSGMQVLKQSRTSVSSVSKEEWDFIVKTLVQGYDKGD